MMILLLGALSLRRLVTLLTLVLVLLLGLFVAVMLRYDLRTTLVDGGEMVYRLDRWSGEVTVMPPEGFAGDIVALSSLATELQELQRIETESRNEQVRERAEQVGDDLFETVLSIREILASYRREAAAALPSERE
jgi:hypothetical protein